MEGVALLEQAEHLYASAHEYGCERVGEEIGARTLAEQVDDFAMPSGESAHGTSEGLAQRARKDVDASVGIKQFRHSMACSSYDSCRVGLVHHD